MIRIDTLNFKLLIILFPVIYIIHEIEEALTIEWFIYNRKPSLAVPGFMMELASLTTAQFLVGGTVVLFLITALCIFAIKNIDNTASLMALTLASATIFCNGIIHCFESILLGLYVPGLITSIFLLIPHGGLLLLKIKEINSYTVSKSILFIFIGGILQLPLAVLTWWLGKSII